MKVIYNVYMNIVTKLKTSYKNNEVKKEPQRWIIGSKMWFNQGSHHRIGDPHKGG